MPALSVNSPGPQSSHPAALEVAPPSPPTPLVPGKQGEQSDTEAKPSIALNVPTGQGAHCAASEVRKLLSLPCHPLGHGVQSSARSALHRPVSHASHSDAAARDDVPARHGAQIGTGSEAS